MLPCHPPAGPPPCQASWPSPSSAPAPRLPAAHTPRSCPAAARAAPAPRPRPQRTRPCGLSGSPASASEPAPRHRRCRSSRPQGRRGGGGHLRRRPLRRRRLERGRWRRPGPRRWTIAIEGWGKVRACMRAAHQMQQMNKQNNAGLHELPPQLLTSLSRLIECTPHAPPLQAQLPDLAAAPHKPAAALLQQSQLLMASAAMCPCVPATNRPRTLYVPFPTTTMLEPSSVNAADAASPCRACRASSCPDRQSQMQSCIAHSGQDGGRQNEGLCESC